MVPLSLSHGTSWKVVVRLEEELALPSRRLWSTKHIINLYPDIAILREVRRGEEERKVWPRPTGDFEPLRKVGNVFDAYKQHEYVGVLGFP